MSAFRAAQAFREKVIKEMVKPKNALAIAAASTTVSVGCATYIRQLEKRLNRENEKRLAFIQGKVSTQPSVLVLGEIC